MKLLKTALLSTILMMGSTYGSGLEMHVLRDASAGEGDSAKTEAGTFADSLRAVREEAQTNLRVMIQITKKVYKGEVIIDNGGECLSYLKALSKGVNALLKEKSDLISERNSLKAQLAGETEAKQKLEKEKEAVEQEIAALNAAKKSTDEGLIAKTKELDTATKRVSELEKSLNELKESATSADEKAQARIQELTSQWVAAASLVNKLTADVERLTAQNQDLTARVAKAEEDVRQLEADNTVADEDLAIIQHGSSDEENGGSGDPLIAGRSAYKGIGSQPGSAWSVRAESLFAPRPSSQSQMPTRKESQTTLTAEGLAAAAKVAALQPKIDVLIDGALSTPRGIQQQQQPSAAEEALTAAPVELTLEQIAAKQQKIVEWICVVMKGEPTVGQKPDNKAPAEDKTNHDNLVKLHRQYALAKGMLEENGLIVSVASEDKARVDKLIKTVEGKRPEWEGEVPNKKSSDTKKRSFREFKTNLEDYNKACSEFIQLTTEQCSPPERCITKKAR